MTKCDIYVEHVGFVVRTHARVLECRSRNHKEIPEIKEKSDNDVDEIRNDYIRNHREIMWISMISKSRTLIERVSRVCRLYSTVCMHARRPLGAAETSGSVNVIVRARAALSLCL